MDNNIAEKALRLVSLGENRLFFGSDHSGEQGAVLHNLIRTSKLNDMDPYRYLSYVIDVIAD